MKRVVVYTVDQKKPKTQTMHYQKIKQLQTDDNPKEKNRERKSRALRTIYNASILGDIIKSINDLKLNDPKTKEGLVITEAVEKISKIIEEMKLDFKKDYWD